MLGQRECVRDGAAGLTIWDGHRGQIGRFSLRTHIPTTPDCGSEDHHLPLPAQTCKNQPTARLRRRPLQILKSNNRSLMLITDYSLLTTVY